jgi:hypothetical protein
MGSCFILLWVKEEKKTSMKITWLLIIVNSVTKETVRRKKDRAKKKHYYHDSCLKMAVSPAELRNRAAASARPPTQRDPHRPSPLGKYLSK